MKPNQLEFIKRNLQVSDTGGPGCTTPPSGSNENYHFLFEQATDAIMVTDFNGNFQDVNSGLCNMFGYTKEELLTMNIRDLLDPEHIRSKPIRFDLLAAGESLFNERKMVHKDGTIVFV